MSKKLEQPSPQEQLLTAKELKLFQDEEEQQELIDIRHPYLDNFDGNKLAMISNNTPQLLLSVEEPENLDEIESMRRPMTSTGYKSSDRK